jgi:hypothetical protein
MPRPVHRDDSGTDTHPLASCVGWGNGQPITKVHCPNGQLRYVGNNGTGPLSQ